MTYVVGQHALTNTLASSVHEVIEHFVNNALIVKPEDVLQAFVQTPCHQDKPIPARAQLARH